MVLEVLTLKQSAIGSFLYFCGREFTVAPLEAELEDVAEYGVVVLTGKQLYIGSVRGEERRCLFSLCVDLPRKHCRGGQSQARFQRQRV